MLTLLHIFIIVWEDLHFYYFCLNITNPDILRISCIFFDTEKGKFNSKYR